ncbi:MAG: SRPBCC family protein [Chloroflexota bacterium]
MNTFQVASDIIVNAPAQQVYDILADYDVGHRAILPEKYFKEMTVLEGGKGAGTKIRVEMEVMGNQSTFNLVVTEPEPGRILEESDAEAGISTVFTIEPRNEGAQSWVEIRSTNRGKPGLMGKLEQWVVTAVTKRIYREELANLNEYAQRVTA